MACSAWILLLLLLHVILHAPSLAQLPVTAREEKPLSSQKDGSRSGPLQRSRRKASIDTSSAVEYMIALRDSLTDANGIPRTATDDPTNVWCLLDKDLLDEVHRLKPSNKRCRVLHRFRFSVKALSEMLQQNKVFLQKGIFRTYMDVILRYFKQDDSITVHITSEFTVTSNSSHIIFGGEEDVSVTADSSGWIELNVTTGLKQIQQLAQELNETIELAVTIEVNCITHKKVPASLVDPASVPLSQGPRRQRLSQLQPMLLVYLSDEQVKTEIQQEAHPPSEVGELIGEEGGRKKREARACHLEDFTVNFHNIDLTYILAPYEYNARKCVGLCDHSVLRYRGHIATNHAKIMASSVAIQNYNPNTQFHHQPTDPCCVPTKYESMSLLIFNDELKYAVYPTMTVTDCGCR